MAISDLPLLRRWTWVQNIPLLHRVRLSWLLSGAIALLVVGTGGVITWEYSNSTAFCGTRCHTMPPEYVAYTQSQHARVACVECHIGRVGFFKEAALKSGHGGHLTSLIFNSYERPIRLKTLRPARETCETCHWPEAFYEDRVREVRHYAPDEPNSLSTTFLIMRTGGGAERQGGAKGIHWHIENKVQYVATDRDKLNIPWVRVIDDEGLATDYVDVTQELPADALSTYQVQEMDCLDCHNRNAHLFRSPEQSLDEALSSGRIDATLPFVKEKGVELLTLSYGNVDEGKEAIRQLPEYYQAYYPPVYEAKKEAVQQAAAAIGEIFDETVFPDMSVGWSSYPNMQGHKDSPGCFRCHDGKHLNEQGDAIRLQCNICHSIPVVLGANEAPKAEELGKQLVTAAEPASHQAPSFMADHRFQASESCEECHGPIEFGADDSSFCSNSACHGRQWPQVQLDAGQAHPIALEGAHAQTWCYRCHNGQRKPAYICANCHEDPHGLGHESCEECHTTVNWVPFGGAPTDRLNDKCIACHGETLSSS